MNIPETATLLAMVAASDRRTVGEVDVEVWHDALRDLSFDDCRDAVREHIRSSTAWLMPAMVRAIVKRQRADRLDRAPLSVPDADPEKPLEWIRALREGRMRDADGLTARDMRALPSLRSPADPAVIEQAKRAAIPTRRPKPEPVDSEAMARARAEVAAMEVVAVPGEEP